MKRAWTRYLKSRLEGSEKLLIWQEFPGAVPRKVDMFEIELCRLGVHELGIKTERI